MNELVTSIYNDNRYKSICKGIAKKPLLAEELHSTFILELLEIKDDRLITAKQGGYLEVFCCGIIHNIWSVRGRVRVYKVGETSPLYEFSNSIDVSENLFENSEEYNFEYDYKYEKAKTFIDREREHPNIERMYPARVFNYVHNVYGNAAEFSRASKISYDNIRRTLKEFTHTLRKKIEDE